MTQLASDHDVATGVYPDMREHGWETDAWPDLYPIIPASDILVVAGPIWLDRSGWATTPASPSSSSTGDD